MSHSPDFLEELIRELAEHPLVDAEGYLNPRYLIYSGTPPKIKTERVISTLSASARASGGTD